HGRVQRDEFERKRVSGVAAVPSVDWLGGCPHPVSSPCLRLHGGKGCRRHRSGILGSNRPSTGGRAGLCIVSEPHGNQRLLIVGNPEEVHVGAHFLEGATALKVPAELADVREAYRGPGLVRRVNWWLRGRRPTRLRAFSRAVLATCSEWRPRWLLATGIA